MNEVHCWWCSFPAARMAERHAWDFASNLCRWLTRWANLQVCRQADRRHPSTGATSTTSLVTIHRPQLYSLRMCRELRLPALWMYPFPDQRIIFVVNRARGVVLAVFAKDQVRIHNGAYQQRLWSVIWFVIFLFLPLCPYPLSFVFIVIWPLLPELNE